jgi:hypothetical protein
MKVILASMTQHDSAVHDDSGIPNFSDEISTAAVFVDIEKALHTTWHPGLLYKPY